MSTAKKFAGQTALYGLTTIASRTLSFFLTPVYTATLSGDNFGVLTIMFSYVSILNAVMAFGMETTFFRYLNKYADKARQVYNNSFGVIFVLTIVFLLIVFPFANTIASLIQSGDKISVHEYATYIRLFAGVLVIDAWCVIPFAKLRADGHPGKYGMIKFVNIIVFITLNLTFLLVLPYWTAHNMAGTAFINQWFVKGWVGYIFIANLVASTVSLIQLSPQLFKISNDFDGSMLREMFSYSWPVLIANLSFLVNENLDKLLLSKMLPQNVSVREVGIYGGCAKIAIFLSIFVQAFRLGAEPFFFNHAKNKNAGQTYARIMNYFVIVVAVIFVALIANIEILKHFVRNKSFWVGLNVVPPLVFGYVCLGIYMNLSVWYKLSDQTRYGLYISGIGAVLTIVLNVIFIPKYSYIASAWISLAAYASMMVLSYLWGQKNYPIPYNIKKNLAYILISVVLVYLSFTVFHRNIYIGNGLLILFGLGALFSERNELKAIFNR